MPHKREVRQWNATFDTYVCDVQAVEAVEDVEYLADHFTIDPKKIYFLTMTMCVLNNTLSLM